MIVYFLDFVAWVLFIVTGIFTSFTDLTCVAGVQRGGTGKVECEKRDRWAIVDRSLRAVPLLSRNL